LRKHKHTKAYAISRSRRSFLLTAILLVAAVIVGLDRSPLRHKWRPRPEDSQKYHAQAARVVKVVDGDTLDIDIPDANYRSTRIRLWGIDTPETKSPVYGVMYFGPEASQFAKHTALDQTVIIYLDPDNKTRDKYGRLLAYVKLPDGRILNELLLSEGFAYADLRFRHSSFNRYSQLEAAARAQKKGLWKEVTREQLPQWLQREKPNLLSRN